MLKWRKHFDFPQKKYAAAHVICKIDLKASIKSDISWHNKKKSFLNHLYKKTFVFTVSLVEQYSADFTHNDENSKFQIPVPSTPQSPIFSESALIPPSPLSRNNSVYPPAWNSSFTLCRFFQRFITPSVDFTG